MNTSTQREQPGKGMASTALFEHAALASVSDGVVISDTEGRVVLLNRVAVRLLGGDGDAVLGRPIDVLFEPLSARGRLTISEAMGRVRADPDSFAASGRSAEAIFEIGASFIRAQLSPVLTDEGEFLGIVTVFRDITREVEADRARSDFISNASHELRLPLTAIKGYCDLLLYDTVDQLDQEQTRFLRIVQSNADHLVALINDLWDISRVESYRLDLDVQPVQMEMIVRDVANAIQSQCDEKGLRLTVDIDPRVGTVLGDPIRLRQVVSNLANYAYRRTAEGGHITLALSGSDKGLQVGVTDTGPTISSSDRSRIFQRFYKTEDSLAHKTESTGLELPVAKILVEMHGGRMWAESDPSRGTTFAFALPVYVGVPGADAGEAAKEPRPARTVLVVEDDETIAQLIALQLRREGFEVLTTAYGEEAVSLAQTEAIDLVTLDVMLPDISGMEVLHRFKANPETAEIPVIVVSVLQPDQTADAEQEAAEYITKPFAFRKLMDSIRRTLGSPQPDMPDASDEAP